MKTLLESSRAALLAVLALSVLAACGGGGGTGGTGATTPPGDGGGGGGTVFSTGVMTKGSTIVNGVRFDDTTANISIDDTPKTNAALQNGMVVKLVGTVNADGINGTAQRVKALIEARGTPTSVSPGANPPSFVVLGQTVSVDDQTEYSDTVNRFNSITTSKLIEVHGLRDMNGVIRATRIEDRPAQMGNSTLDEIRGVVNGTGTNPATFTIAGQMISFAGTVIPNGASWQNGSVVEVYCGVRPCIDGSGVFRATQLKVEDAQDDAFKPASGQKVEVEGLISGFRVHPGDFSVGTTPVTTTSATRFEGGVATDLANDVKVEAEGSWNGTRLVASKIEFKRSVVRVQGNVTAVGSQFTMDVAGHLITIRTDSQTSNSGPTVFPACVQVRGQRAVPATPLVVLAGEISNCSNSGRPFVQAPVEAENGATLTLLGFDIDVSNPVGEQPQWEDANGQGITLAAFLSAVTPATTNAAGVSVPGTLVKVIFNDGGVNTVRQAEIED